MRAAESMTADRVLELLEQYERYWRSTVPEDGEPDDTSEQYRRGIADAYLTMIEIIAE